MANQLIEGMKSGNGLSHIGAIYRINAICFSFLTKKTEQNVVSHIAALKEDETMLDGYSVSDYAKAALSLMGVEQYQGNNARIIDLINSGFSFLVE